MSADVWGICPVCGGDLITDRTLGRWVHLDPRIADHKEDAS